MGSMTDDIQRHCSLPSLQSSTYKCGSKLGENCYLPPPLHVCPLPGGQFHWNPFISREPLTAPGPQTSVQCKSPWPGSEPIAAAPPPAGSAESSWQEFFGAPKVAPTERPNYLNPPEIMALIAPNNINGILPIQQNFSRKRKGGTNSPDSNGQQKKHRIAEQGRRMRLSQLLRELNCRIPDSFLEHAGWNKSGKLIQSKEQIVQGAICFIDSIAYPIRQEQLPPRLSQKLQTQAGVPEHKCEMKDGLPSFRVFCEEIGQTA